LSRPDRRRRGGGKGGYGRGKGRKGSKPKADPSVEIARFRGAWSVVLGAGRSTAAAVGHPWVFSGAIAAAHPPGDEAMRIPGAPCMVFDHKGQCLGQGYHNAESQLAVRLALPWNGDEGDKVAVLSDDELVTRQLNAARSMRRARGLIGAGESAFRLCNGAGDGLPGVTIDRFADGAVVLVSTAGAARWIDALIGWLKRHDCAWVVVRSGGDTHPSEGLGKGLLREFGEVPERVEVDHHGVALSLTPRDGAKSGLFLDQWHNHLAVAKLCDGAFVVDAYSHVGGFGLHAARAGAAKVLCVDASLRACEAVEQAAASAGLEQVEITNGDAIHVLADLAEGFASDGSAAADKPDMVIVDPPKFATRGARPEDALRKYTHLNRTAMQAMADEGWLVSCSCSGRIDTQTFLRMIAHAARRAGRIATVVELRGPGPDHPTAPAHDEARYLKVAICRVRRV